MEDRIGKNKQNEIKKQKSLKQIRKKKLTLNEDKKKVHYFDSVSEELNPSKKEKVQK